VLFEDFGTAGHAEKKRLSTKVTKDTKGEQWGVDYEFV
jgi:hypothetical protein